ncbi:NADPH-dependent FMN reductase [Burkholderia ubonensis]|uniref:NADPH-dependent oxidoreductase n=1 Tax=Burkholderia ubonensis TaxID=101571 RepID=A0AB74D3U8_9BURK|nr:NAD(P)H-dependent oxidoreductase [Burkholderia ubonensis]PAJ80844.1 FMN reductase [Burkholderia ubonensis]PAJ88122.1 FMN reductase [Burkholderia ubonensis]PAJ96055.1 FMN reductase [Burkholderia ubonensis]PAK01257.1 FMN reductase [Burkholderia ubonensis]PAK08562.1 FMN reductase [Burkholderia ubonensis]
MSIKILAFCGSTRSGSFNQKLLDIAAQGALESGAQVTHIHLNDYPLPFYDGDLERESGLPEAAQALQKRVKECDAVLIASPDYNGGYSAVLKNSLDWISRPNGNGQAGLACFAEKPAAVISASPGLLGGSRGQAAIRGVLDKLGMLVIPQTFALGAAHEAFDELHRLKDVRAEAMVRAVGSALAQTAAKLRQ